MNGLKAKVTALEKRLDDAIRAEAALTATLKDQQRALLGGAVEQVLAANHALDGVYEELRVVAGGCRQALAALVDDLGLDAGAPLAQALARLPRDLAPQLKERRERLVGARRQARLLAARNSSAARASLDAITAVRGILARAARDPASDGRGAAPAARLDATA
ncbi:MAG: hypothetical protein HY812_12585 [Planctomycetes bacterium]|nr:hypothetical protein [Planctomycetota bacterium]